MLKMLVRHAYSSFIVCSCSCSCLKVFFCLVLASSIVIKSKWQKNPLECPTWAVGWCEHGCWCSPPTSLRPAPRLTGYWISGHLMIYLCVFPYYRGCSFRWLLVGSGRTPAQQLIPAGCLLGLPWGVAPPDFASNELKLRFTSLLQSALVQIILIIIIIDSEESIFW
jgi:hypothetical protein